MRLSSVLLAALPAIIVQAGCTATLEPVGERFQEGGGDVGAGGSGDGDSSDGDDADNTGGTFGLGSGGSGPASGGGESTGGQGSSGGGPGSGGSGPVPSKAGCKRGISFDRWVNEPALADLDALRPDVDWFYNWAPTPNPSFDGQYGGRGFEFVPMVWNGQFDQNAVIDQIPGSAKYLLGFNEPNVVGNGGTNMTLQSVVNLWPQVEAIADAHDLTLVGPAVTFTNIQGALNGPEFMIEFFKQCPSCRVDAIAMHTYTCDVQWVRDHIEPYRQFGLPIWVTEFACLDGNAETVRKFMRETVAFFEGDPDIERYAWFMARGPSTALLSGSGQLTDLGQIYVDLPHNSGCAP